MLQRWRALGTAYSLIQRESIQDVTQSRFSHIINLDRPLFSLVKETLEIQLFLAGPSSHIQYISSFFTSTIHSSAANLDLISSSKSWHNFPHICQDFPLKTKSKTQKIIMHLFKYTTTTTFINSLLLLILSSHALAVALDHLPPIPTSPSSNLTLRDDKGKHEDFGNDSFDCEGIPACYNGLLEKFHDLAINNIEGSCSAKPGQPLFCLGIFCTFHEGTDEELSVWQAEYLMEDLRTYGCRGCGTTPFNWPMQRGQKDGVMKIDMYRGNKHGCEGFCIPDCWWN